MRETYYSWREAVEVDGAVRLLFPRRDPYEWEEPFDYIFKTPEEAREALVDFDVPQDESKSWKLCFTTTDTVEQ